MSRPSPVCRLQKGKFVGGCTGFVDTFNWVVSFISNLKCRVEETTGDEPTMEIKDATSDTPTLELKLSSGMKLKSGDDSNIVIQKDETDGYYKIDVYYI